jgi:predicted unusual protein kinase regulating ubiquinone biosynthesis (AarF/ABC1/UbiB family)
LGQVHAALLKTGEEVAVKIQYPGIARTIREDIRNLLLCMLPGRLSRNWENTKEQFEDLRVRLERETDYLQEAASLERARALFRRLSVGARSAIVITSASKQEHSC